MSLKLLLDEDSQAKYLVNLLQASRHEILTVNQAALAGQPDLAVLSYAKEHAYVLLTRNCGDFHELHLDGPLHSGILAIYQSADESKNMSYKDITRAIANLEKSALSLENQFFILNQWNY